MAVLHISRSLLPIKLEIFTHQIVGIYFLLPIAPPNERVGERQKDRQRNESVLTKFLLWRCALCACVFELTVCVYFEMLYYRFRFYLPRANKSHHNSYGESESIQTNKRKAFRATDELLCCEQGERRKRKRFFPFSASAAQPLEHGAWRWKYNAIIMLQFENKSIHFFFRPLAAVRFIALAAAIASVSQVFLLHRFRQVNARHIMWLRCVNGDTNRTRFGSLPSFPSLNRV